MAETIRTPVENLNVRHEASDWRVGIVGLVLLGIFVFLVIAPLVLMWAFPHSLRDVDRRLAVAPPAPRLQTNPAQDLAKFRADEDKRLNSYYWIDKQKGIVHIPIEQAMRKLAREGIPGFPKATPQ
jgi:hypothetical protein